MRMTEQSDDVAARVAMIFARLFPDLAPNEIPAASMTSVRDWDSIATLSLIVEAEEEFGITIGLDSADVVESFDDLCRVVVRNRRISFADIPPRHLRH